MNLRVPVNTPVPSVARSTVVLGTRSGKGVTSGARLAIPVSVARLTMEVGRNLGVPVHSPVGHVAGLTVEVGTSHPGTSISFLMRLVSTSRLATAVSVAKLTSAASVPVHSPVDHEAR